MFAFLSCMFLATEFPVRPFQRLLVDHLRVISLNPTDLSSHPLCGKAFHPLVSGLQWRSATNGPCFYAKPIIPSLVRVSFVQLVKHSLWSRSLVTSDPGGATLFSLITESLLLTATLLLLVMFFYT